MKKLSSTTKYGVGRASHYHIYYINEEGNKAQIGVSGAPPHDHPLVWQDPTPEIPPSPPSPGGMDPNTGQMIPPNPGSPGQAATPGGWMVGPGGADGHTHELEDEYDIDIPEKKEDETLTVREVLELFRTAHAIEEPSLIKASESEDYYAGKQWKDSDKNSLEKMSRACLTINIIAPKIDEISGNQRQTRTDIHFLPFETGDQRACDLYNVIVKCILQASLYDREKSKVFMDEVITGRGNFNLYVDFSKNLFGDARVEKFPWRGVRYGPHENDDLSDCEYLFKFRKFSKGNLERMYPDKADIIQKDFELFTIDGARHTVYAGDNYAKGDESRSKVIVGGEVMVDTARKEYTLLECWRKVYIDATVAVEAEDEFVESLFGWDTKDIKQVQNMQGFVVIKRNQTKMRITKIAGATVLSDEDPAELPVDDFFLIPVYANKRESEWWGKVEAAKDPQRELNKRRSQAIDMANKMGANGWGFDDSTFPDKNEENKFKRNSTSPGFVVKLNSVTSPPYRFEGPDFPVAMVQLMQMDMENIDKILNISSRDPGANTSSAAILQAQKLKLVGNEFVFDNLSFAERKLGMLLVHTIRKYYTPDRIYRMVSHYSKKRPVLVGGRAFEEFPEDEIMEILQNADITNFDIVVSEASASPTMRMSISMMLQDMMKAGQQVSPKLMTKYLDLPEEDRNEMEQEMEQQAASMSQQSQQQSDAQIEMTLAKQGIFTPRVKAMIGPQEMQSQGEPQQQALPFPDQGGIAEGMPPGSNEQG